MNSSQRLRNPLISFGLLVTALILAALTLSATISWAAWENGSWSTVYSPGNKTPEIRTAPDGAGGLLAAQFDSAQPIFSVQVTRIDHTGNEVWGNEGVVIPFEIGSDGMAGPVDVTDDGDLGAYCAYSRIFGTSYYLYLSHVNAAGSVDWTVPVGDYGPHPEAAVSLEKADNGDLFVIWTRSVGTLDQELIVTRVDNAGAQVWETTAWPDNNNDLDQLVWTASTDQLGGVLLGIHYQGFSGLFEGRVQRVAATGGIQWGPFGTQVFGSLGHVVDVMPDAVGGAYVMNSIGWGETWAQHVDATGAATWASGGIKLFTLSTWPNPTEPTFCIDGSGGFYAIEGVENLFAQHVDIYGGLLWGLAGLQITSLAGWQTGPSVDYDGFGGFVVAYDDHYFSQLGDYHPRALSAARFDAFGNQIWKESGFWQEPFIQPEFFVAYPRVTADASGGALVLWNRYDNAYTTGEILAAGLGSDGSNPATPTLTYIDPDAGEIGGVQQAFVLGDYLEPSQTYSLVQPGAPDMVLTGMSSISPQLVTGTLDLATAQLGPYDLELSNGGTTLATLPNAYGVGQMVPCTQDEPMPVVAGQFLGFGSQRRMAFDSQGSLHSCWLEYGTDGVYRLSSAVTRPDHAQTVRGIYDAAYTLRDLSFALGSDGTSHIVVVEDDGSSADLWYFKVAPTGEIGFLPLTMPGGVRNPVVAVDATGQVHVVYESGSGAQAALYHMTLGPGSTGTPQNLNVGNNPVYPDLTDDGNGLMLTFVRDFWFPGLREVCYQHFDGSTWDAPVSMYFGVYVKTPSVAFDGVDKLLFSWVLDNTGTDPLLHTMLMTNHVAGSVRWRKGLSSVFACSVDASGPGRFQLLTMEDDGTLPTNILLREGDGEVFYPRRRLNGSADVDFPYFCARYGMPGIAAMWAEYSDPAVPVYRFVCFEGNPVSAVETPLAVAGVNAYPNPFNPSTMFSYSQRSAGWAKLVIYNLAGDRVRTLVDGFGDAGPHNISWDGRDTGGRVLPSGVYFSRLQLPGGQREAVTKVTMLK